MKLYGGFLILHRLDLFYINMVPFYCHMVPTISFGLDVDKICMWILCIHLVFVNFGTNLLPNQR